MPKLDLPSLSMRKLKAKIRTTEAQISKLEKEFDWQKELSSSEE